MKRRFLVALGIALATGFAAWCLMPDTVVARRGMDPDEAVYLMVARLLNGGHPSSSFFFDQFWLFPKTLAAAFRLFGDSLVVGRLTVFGFSLAGLIGIAVLSHQVGAKWAAPVAILCGAVEPLYLKQSRVAMSDVPSAACMVWALASLLAFQKSRCRFFVVLSGACAAASLVMKPLAIGFAVPLVILLLAPRARREAGRLHLNLTASTADLFVFVAAGIITAACFVDLLHPLNEYRRTIGFHLAERNWLAGTAATRWLALVGFTRRNVPWLAFAAIGIAALRPFSIAAFALLAGELISTAVLLQMPPWLHHYVLLIPPLVVFSVLGLYHGFNALKQWIADIRGHSATSNSRRFLAMTFVGAVIVTSVDLPWIARYDHRALHPEPNNLESIIRHLEVNTALGDYLLSDDVMIPYLAHRLVPPSAINLTFAATFKFDQSSNERLDAMLRQYPVAGIIVSARFQRNAHLMSWIKANFPISTRLGGYDDTAEACLYTRDKEKP